MIKIVLVEDHLLIRELWKDLLLQNENYCVVGEAENINDAYKQIELQKPDIIVTDMNLNGENGANLIYRVCDTIPNPRIIVVSMNDEYSYIKKLFSIGIRGYVTKKSPKKDLLESIEKVYNGEIFFCSEVKKIFLHQSINFSKDYNYFLSFRELDIVRFITRGMGNKQIAEELNLSIKTIEGHKTKIYKKLGVQSIAEIISFGKLKGMDF